MPGASHGCASRSEGDMATIVVVESDSDGARTLLTALRQALEAISAAGGKELLSASYPYGAARLDGVGDPFTFLVDSRDRCDADRTSSDHRDTGPIVCGADGRPLLAGHGDEG